mgnify:CR=1 FL=1
MGVIPDALKKMGPQDKVLALVKSVHGEQVEVVRAFDGEDLYFKQSKIFGTSGSLEGSLDHEKKAALWKKYVMEGRNPTLNPLGRSHPMLALGLGELDEETRESSMMPHSKIKTVAPTSFTSGNRITYPGSGVVDEREKIDLQDQAEDVANYLGIRHDTEIQGRVLESGETGGGGGGGAGMILMVAGIALFVAMS